VHGYASCKVSVLMIRIVFALIAVPLLLLETAFLGRPHPTLSPWAIANVAIYPLITLASVALHEGGHALVARLLGLDVPLVQLGVGRRVAAWRWGKTGVTLHALPLLGLTYLGSRRRDGLRWRYWLAVAAGPLVTLAIVAATCHDPWPRRAVASGFAPMALVGNANLLILLLSLVPLPLLRGRGLLRNDGTQLLTVPFMSAKRLQILRETPTMIEAQSAQELGDHAGARRIIEAALVDAPGSWTLRYTLAHAQLYLEQLGEARATYLTLLEEDPEPADLRWMARNNLAWTDFQLGDPAHLAEADEHSAAVYARFKQVEWAISTRGAVLG
jgi:hypothetical protein